MTVHENGYGESEETRYKLEQLRGLIKMHVGICAGQAWCRDYRYIDMNAGPGIMDVSKQSGSPLIFLETASHAPSLPYHALMVEKDAGYVDQLRERVRLFPHVTVAHGDHAAIVPTYVSGLSGKPTGLIFHDPKGVPSFETLAQVTRMAQAQRMDILIYMSATNLKRPNGWKARRGRPDTTLKEGIGTIGKTTWLIRRPRTNKCWTFIIGSNWTDFPTWKRAGFVRLDSAEGQAILEQLTWKPKPESPGSQLGWIFDDIKESQS